MDENGSQTIFYKRQTISLILALFLMIGCSSDEVRETPNDVSTAPVETTTEATTPEAYEYVVPQVFATISIQDNGYIPKLDYINQKLVDSIK